MAYDEEKEKADLIIKLDDYLKSTSKELYRDDWELLNTIRKYLIKQKMTSLQEELERNKSKLKEIGG